MKKLKKILIGILAVFGGLILLCFIIGLCTPASDETEDKTEQQEVADEAESNVETESAVDESFDPNDAVAYADLICADGDHKLTLYNMGTEPDSIGAHFESVNDSTNTYDVLLYVDSSDPNSYYSEDKSINIWCGEDMIYRVTNSSKDYWEFSAEYHMIDDENYSDDTSDTVDDAGISEDYSDESDYYDEEGAGGDEEEPAFLDDSNGPDFFRDRNNIGNPVFISGCRVMMYDQSSDCMTATLSEGSNVILLLENVSCASSQIYYTGDFINVYGVYDGVSGSTPAIDLYSVELQ